MSPLHLSLTDFQSETRWRWQLNDERGNIIADHEVNLDPGDNRYRGFVDLPKYLSDYTPAFTEAHLLNEIGKWIGEKIFGGLINALRESRQFPATIIRVTVPPEAQGLLSLPFELADLDGQPFAKCGIRFVYQTTSTSGPSPIQAVEGSLRVLAIFSLPDDQHPLNLRRERYQLTRLLDIIAQTHGVAIEMRVIQYGASRKTLEDALTEAPGWDVIHFSGHGLEGMLALEKDDGQLDVITTDQLKPLLRLTKTRLKLLTLSACLSGAATVQASKAQLGMVASPGGGNAPALTVLPGLAQELARDLDCAAVAMRYSVDTNFAEHLLLAMYRLMFEKHQTLPDALQLALRETLEPDGRCAAPVLSPITPIVFGACAADLTLTAPKRQPHYEMPITGLLNFPDGPDRFVGRLMPMLRATHALAPESPLRGVLLYGMAGAGKTTCAVELAYRHEQGRFTGYVWHKVPNEGDDIAQALLNFLVDLETQLDISEHPLVANVDDPVTFETRTLPRLKQMLSNSAALIVIDNLEGLLTGSDNWRDPKWGKLIDTLLAHTGPSRVVITSRRMPASLKANSKLLREAIHALSFGESVLLARELPNLQPLFDSADGRELLTRVLRLAQGHPKLLELADRMASDLDALEVRIDQAERDADVTHAPLADFFDTGETNQGVENFNATLRGWTIDLTKKLVPTSRLLFHFVCRLEDEDRKSNIIEANWRNFLKRLAQAQEGQGTRDEATYALTELNFGLDLALDALVSSGLIESRPLQNQRAEVGNQKLFRLHPFIAESGLQDAPPAVLTAADFELGRFYIDLVETSLRTEMQGGGPLIVEFSKRAAPYLMRTQRWQEANELLEKVIQRDHTPAVISFVLPLLNRIAEETKGTDLGLQVAVNLVTTLQMAGRYPEAEPMWRDLITICVARGNYRFASISTGNLITLLMKTDRPKEALQFTEQKVDYTRRAGFGPWTQLGDQVQTMQIWYALKYNQEVLAQVQKLRMQVEKLPEESRPEETVLWFNVREGLLGTGRDAALQLEQWDIALDLNAQIVQFKRKRGAAKFDLAGARLNDYGPLLHLNRLAEVQTVLDECREVFEIEHAIPELGKVFSALAALEDKKGNCEAASKFQETALCYLYLAGNHEDCAICHNNLANYLAHASDESPQVILAHRLAGCLIHLQTNSRLLDQSISNLTLSVPETLTFDQVADLVEQIEGVHFRKLFEDLTKDVTLDGLPQGWQYGDVAVLEVSLRRNEKLKQLNEQGEAQSEEVQMLIKDAAKETATEPVEETPGPPEPEIALYPDPEEMQTPDIPVPSPEPQIAQLTRPKAMHRPGIPLLPSEPRKKDSASVPAVRAERYANYRLYHMQHGKRSDLGAKKALRVGDQYELEVWIAAEATGMPIADEQGKRRTIREPGNTATVTIYVLFEPDTTYLEFDENDRVQTLQLPPNGKGDSTKVRLRVRPKVKSLSDHALAEVGVCFYYNFCKIESMKIVAEVVGSDEDPPYSCFGLEEPVNAAYRKLGDWRSLDEIQRREMTIEVGFLGNDRYELTFLYEGVNFTGAVRLTKEEVESDILSARNELEYLALDPCSPIELKKKSVLRDEVLKLVQMGRDLWNRVFHSEENKSLWHIGQFLQQNPLKSDGIIRVVVKTNATGFVFPWNLLYDQESLPDARASVGNILNGFWGMRYCIEQIREDMQSDLSDRPVQVDKKLQLSFILSNFDNTDAQKQFVKGLPARSQKRISVGKPIVAAADCDTLLRDCHSHILYFYTRGYTRRRMADIAVQPDSKHGDHGEPILDKSSIELVEGKLYLDELMNERNLINLYQRPIVFLNMCESGQITPSLSEGFVQLFLDEHASAVIGTECPMTTAFAHPFAVTLLDALFSGDTLGMALLKARRKFLKPNNLMAPLGLAYTLYGLATVHYQPALLP